MLICFSILSELVSTFTIPTLIYLNNKYVFHKQPINSLKNHIYIEKGKVNNNNRLKKCDKYIYK